MNKVWFWSVIIQTSDRTLYISTHLFPWTCSINHKHKLYKSVINDIVLLIYVLCFETVKEWEKKKEDERLCNKFSQKTEKNATNGKIKPKQGKL